MLLRFCAFAFLAIFLPVSTTTVTRHQQNRRRVSSFYRYKSFPNQPLTSNLQHLTSGPFTVAPSTQRASHTLPAQSARLPENTAALSTAELVGHPQALLLARDENRPGPYLRPQLLPGL